MEIWKPVLGFDDSYKAKGLLRAVKGVKEFVAGKHSSYDN